MLALAIAAGLLIGLSLGALGGGGSILTVPALVYLIGMSPHQATAASLFVVGGASLIGAISHFRAGRVRLREGVIFGVIGVVGSYAGSVASEVVPASVLLAGFGVLMLVVAGLMFVRGRRGGRVGEAQVVGPEGELSPADLDGAGSGGHPAGASVPPGTDPPGTGSPGTGRSRGDGRRPVRTPAGPADGEHDADAGAPIRMRTSVALADSESEISDPDSARTPGPARVAGREPLFSSPKKALILVGAATVVGLVTGFFGVGGGFVVVPALVLALGFEMPIAVGTSLVVIVVNSISALVSRIGHASLALDWPLIALFTGAAIIGTIAGSTVAGRVNPRKLGVAFTMLIVAVAVYTLARSVPGLF